MTRRFWECRRREPTAICALPIRAGVRGRGQRGGCLLALTGVLVAGGCSGVRTRCGPSKARLLVEGFAFADVLPLHVCCFIVVLLWFMVCRRPLTLGRLAGPWVAKIDFPCCAVLWRMRPAPKSL